MQWHPELLGHWHTPSSSETTPRMHVPRCRATLFPDDRAPSTQHWSDHALSAHQLPEALSSSFTDLLPPAAIPIFSGQVPSASLSALNTSTEPFEVKIFSAIRSSLFLFAFLIILLTAFCLF